MLVLYLVLFPRLTPRMIKNVFNSCHVCSVLQMDCISLSWLLFTVSVILKLWLLTILRRKLHFNWITRTVLALKSLSHQMLFLAFLIEALGFLYCKNMIMVGKKNRIYHYILLLRLGPDMLILVYNVYDVLQV